MVTNIGLTVMSWASSLRGTIVEMLKPETGQDFIEYAILTGFIAIAAAVAFLALPLDAAFTDFGNVVKDCVSMNGDCGVP